MPWCKIHVKAFANTCNATLQNHILPGWDFNIVAESEQTDILFDKKKKYRDLSHYECLPDQCNGMHCNIAKPHITRIRFQHCCRIWAKRHFFWKKYQDLSHYERFPGQCNWMCIFIISRPKIAMSERWSTGFVPFLTNLKFNWALLKTNVNDKEMQEHT